MSSGFDRISPFMATLEECLELTKPGSTKNTYHLVLNVGGSNFQYKVGDSVGIYPLNDLALVQRIMAALKVDPLTSVIHPKTSASLPLVSFLESQANLARVTSSLLSVFKEHPSIGKALDNFEATKQLASSLDVVELVEQFGSAPFDLQQFIISLAPMLPRFYSIASSPKQHPEHLHLLVGLTYFEKGPEIRYGVASHFLCKRARLFETSIPCFIQPTQHFTLPTASSTPMIMVGPGTGVAPFRGFLQERALLEHSGKNWLFFGERHQKTDFFYEEFWTHLTSQNKLILDTAFSRDQSHKMYVQHKIVEKGDQIWNWICEGAHIYICGEADPMAKEVEAALISVIQQHGKQPLEEAKQMLKKLRSEKRYLTDVY